MEDTFNVINVIALFSSHLVSYYHSGLEEDENETELTFYIQS